MNIFALALIITRRTLYIVTPVKLSRDKNGRLVWIETTIQEMKNNNLTYRNPRCDKWGEALRALKEKTGLKYVGTIDYTKDQYNIPYEEHHL